MDLSLKYSKTSKGARAVLTKSKGLPSHCMLVLSHIDGKTTAYDVQSQLQLPEEKFSQALTLLLEEAYIQVVLDFGPSIFDLNAAIQVSEISPEEFLNLEVPVQSAAPSQEQLEAEARAKAYAEEQAKKAAQAREQEEAERKLLLVTDILAKSGDKLDIEKLADSAKPQSMSAQAQPAAATQSDDHAAVMPEPIKPPEHQQPSSSIRSTTTESAKPINIPDVEDVAKQAAVTLAEEAERKAQRIAEEEARQLAVQTREEAERQAVAKAEAEAKSRQEAEARAEAERRKRQEAEEKARLKAEEQARREEERKARKEAERARKQAEQQAREEARARAKEEVERKAREDAERRAREKAVTEERARLEAERKAKEKAELAAKRAAESEARVAAAAKAKEEALIRDQALAAQKAEAREEARQRAREKAEARAATWARRKAEWQMTSATWLHSAFSFGRPLLMGTTALFVILLLMLQFINLSMLAPAIEKSASTRIGEPVKIMNVRLSVWPKPHLILEGLMVGEMADITARSAELYLTLPSYLSDRKTLDSLEIEGLVIPPESLPRTLHWPASAQAQKLQLETIELKNVLIKLPMEEFLTFDVDIELDSQGQLKEAKLNSKNISALLTPSNRNLQVDVEARGWQAPIGPPLTFDELTATGTAEDGKLVLNKVEGSLYGGTFKGIATLNWKSGWQTEGTFEVANIKLDQATSALSQAASMQGSLNGRADFSANATAPTALFDNANVNARFEAQHGEIGGLDLARAASGRQQVGGTTRYDTFSGNWLLKDKSYHLTQLELKAGSLHAQGDLLISPEQEVSGKVQTLLTLSSRQLQGRFGLAGKLGNVKISR
ncbi:MAG TPA: AsmA family protein [Methylophilaceae bacterium]|nr:AsmA family protein [Methylophilaceae bacterium]